jgi:hypothetical protein
MSAQGTDASTAATPKAVRRRVTAEHTLTRVRENQRSHRARKQKLAEDLEAENRRLLEENTRLTAKVGLLQHQIDFYESRAPTLHEMWEWFGHPPADTLAPVSHTSPPPPLRRAPAAVASTEGDMQAYAAQLQRAVTMHAQQHSASSASSVGLHSGPSLRDIAARSAILSQPGYPRSSPHPGSAQAWTAAAQAYYNNSTQQTRSSTPANLSTLERRYRAAFMPTSPRPVPSSLRGSPYHSGTPSPFFSGNSTPSPGQAYNAPPQWTGQHLNGAIDPALLARTFTAPTPASQRT